VLCFRVSHMSLGGAIASGFGGSLHAPRNVERPERAALRYLLGRRLQADVHLGKREQTADAG